MHQFTHRTFLKQNKKVWMVVFASEERDRGPKMGERPFPGIIYCNFWWRLFFNMYMHHVSS